jgi:hypothetical protein
VLWLKQFGVINLAYCSTVFSEPFHLFFSSNLSVIEIFFPFSQTCYGAF